jgi:hypothetical protein
MVSRDYNFPRTCLQVPWFNSLEFVLEILHPSHRLMQPSLIIMVRSGVQTGESVSDNVARKILRQKRRHIAQLETTSAIRSWTVDPDAHEVLRRRLGTMITTVNEGQTRSGRPWYTLMG